MNDKWFKLKQKEAGVTADVIGRELGRDRSVVSRIYVGRQKMTLDQAKVFARVLRVPLDDVLHHAGLVDTSDAAPGRVPGFSDSEVVTFRGTPARSATHDIIAREFGGTRPGIECWQIRSDALLLAGYRRGDTILVDTNAADLCRKGDTVIAQLYDWKSGTAETVLRQYEPPVIIGLAPGGAGFAVHVVDNNNVAIKGRVIASWRAPGLGDAIT